MAEKAVAMNLKKMHSRLTLRSIMKWSMLRTLKKEPNYWSRTSWRPWESGDVGSRGGWACSQGQGLRRGYWLHQQRPGGHGGVRAGKSVKTPGSLQSLKYVQEGGFLRLRVQDDLAICYPGWIPLIPVKEPVEPCHRDQYFTQYFQK